MPASPRMITLAEVEQHATYDDLWLVIDGKVYDVTPFMDDHPGGGEIMLNAAGKDGTDDFEDVGHSPGAREQLKKYEIGAFAGGESSIPRPETTAPERAPRSRMVCADDFAQFSFCRSDGTVS